MTTIQPALADELREQALRMGFSLVGIARPDASAHISFYRDWIEEGRHGEMAYLSRPDSVSRRADLDAALENVRSVLVVAHEYFVEDPSAADWAWDGEDELTFDDEDCAMTLVR